MGIFDKVFGRKSAGIPLPDRGKGGGTSLAGALAQQNEKLGSKSCDKCGTTYLSSERQVFILSVRAPDMSLDIGGYCSRCRKQLCQRHLAFARVMPTPLPDPDKVKDFSYGVVCESCGTQVRPDRNADPDRYITIISLDAKDLEPARPKPKSDVAAPSGKFSLHKILVATVGRASDGRDPFPSMICMQCFAFHPHPVPAPILGFDAFRKSGYEVSPSDFEVDIGGDCEQCGGAICGRHIELREVTVQGTTGLALFCSTHGTQLS